MDLQYLITETNQDTLDLSQWVANNLPNLTACGIFTLGTDHSVSFINSDKMSADELKGENLIKFDAETLTGIEEVIRSIRKFDFHVTGSLSKYNPLKKVFIVDLKHRVGNDLDDGATIEALSTVSCTLNSDFSFTIIPSTLKSTHASCWCGEDEWGEDQWLNVGNHRDLSIFHKEFKGNAYGVDVKDYIITLIDKLYIESIQNNLPAFTKQAESMALVQ